MIGLREDVFSFHSIREGKALLVMKSGFGLRSPIVAGFIGMCVMVRAISAAPTAQVTVPADAFSRVEATQDTVVVSGTCNAEAVGYMSLTNLWSGQSGWIPASTTWSATVELAYGCNVFSLTVTNSGGQANTSATFTVCRTLADLESFDAWAARRGIPGAAGGADNDLDGYTNEQEYQADTDPTDASDHFADGPDGVWGDGQRLYLSLPGPTTNSRVYDVFYSTNIVRGRWAPMNLEITGAVDGAAVNIPFPNLSGAGTLRVGARLPARDAPYIVLSDMVHNNPGEIPFDSMFNGPEVLLDYGYRALTFKDIHTLATFDALGLDLYPTGSPQRAWLDTKTAELTHQLRVAKDNGLKVFSHIDLFGLPSNLVAQLYDELTISNKISILREKTREVHQVMFDEIATRFPELDGYFVRVGELYLYDYPYHAGNGAIRYGQSDTQTNFIALIDFLRSAICVSNNRTLIFRTWDTADRYFHASSNFYLNVTERVEPHPNLYFAIKHTALDFWRNVRFNPCIGIGRHPQIVEVQCQREFEGKGAFPNYIANLVIDGFPEYAIVSNNLRNLLANPRVRGVSAWARGGGWYGPYITNETWCAMNAWVIGRWAQNPTQSEEAVFNEFCATQLGLSGTNISLMRQLALKSADAVLKGLYCTAYDRLRADGEYAVKPTGTWVRDDTLGGTQELNTCMSYLYNKSLFDTAMVEKAESVALWEDMTNLFEQIAFTNTTLQGELRTTVIYGERLFKAIRHAWRAFRQTYTRMRSGAMDTNEMVSALADFDTAWTNYLLVTNLPACPSLFRDVYLNSPPSGYRAGLRGTIDGCRATINP